MTPADKILFNLSYCVKSWVIPNSTMVSARERRLTEAIPFTRLYHRSREPVEQRVLLVPSTSSTDAGEPGLCYNLGGE